MQILRLQSEHFRNLAPSGLCFHPRLNLIHGDNGSGKTALLEALYFLGRGKSFRENQTRHLIAHGQAHFRLIAELGGRGGAHRLGIERSLRDYILRLDGENLTALSQLAQLLPLQIINSDHFALIDQGPEHRRRFTDYGLFYHDSRFLPAWQRYQYALKNRNAALRQNWDDAYIRPWHSQLQTYADTIDRLRRDYLAELEARLNRYHHELGALETLHIRYQRGWQQDSELGELLTRHLARDRQLKHTRDGIHRAEWRIFDHYGQDSAHTFSRGQQKTLICALILAQTALIAEKSGKHPLILVDDIAAELDGRRREMLLQFLLDSGSQLFITAIRREDLPSLPAAAHRFHLVRGEIRNESEDNLE